MKHLRLLTSVVLFVVPLALYAQLAGTAGATAMAAASAQHLQQRTNTGSSMRTSTTTTVNSDEQQGSCDNYAYVQAYQTCSKNVHAHGPSLSDIDAGGGAGGR